MSHNYWACFMFLVWTQSLEDRRRALWKAEALREGYGMLSPDWEPLAAECARKEARVNKALVARNKWKKRACENCRTKVRRLEA